MQGFKQSFLLVWSKIVLRDSDSHTVFTLLFQIISILSHLFKYDIKIGMCGIDASVRQWYKQRWTWFLWALSAHESDYWTGRVLEKGSSTECAPAAHDVDGPSANGPKKGKRNHNLWEQNMKMYDMDFQIDFYLRTWWTCFRDPIDFVSYFSSFYRFFSLERLSNRLFP